jgi:hypothetical protein
MFKTLDFPLETASEYVQHIRNRLLADVLMRDEDQGNGWIALILVSHLPLEELLDAIEKLDKQGLMGNPDRWVRCEDGRWVKWWCVPAEEREETMNAVCNERPGAKAARSVFDV